MLNTLVFIELIAANRQMIQTKDVPCFIMSWRKPLPSGGGCRPTPLRRAVDFKIASVYNPNSFRGLGSGGPDEMHVEKFGLPSSVKQQPLFVLAMMRASNNLEGLHGENQVEAPPLLVLACICLPLYICHGGSHHRDIMAKKYFF